ncbi:MAG: Nif3-like dinuclear metal center hexameric protein [Bacteroidota bacterium]
MTVGDIIRICEQWAPRGAAWEKDNVGLQIGTTSKRVRKILIALEVTERVVHEAIRKKSDLIITHHPLFFRLPRALTDSTNQGKIAREIIKHDISLYAMHTNIDRVRDGVNWTLARELGLQEITFLKSLEKSMVKIVTFVPREMTERISQEMAVAGAGIIGKYTECSFRVKGVGTYRPDIDAKPWAGTPGLLESAEEIRLEMVAPRWNVPAIIDALLRAHPYEEVAYDIYPVENGSPNYGIGAIGTFPTPMPASAFLNRVKKKISWEGFRYTTGKKRTIRRVAVCGGSGAEYLDAAILSGADAFVTADISYHVFQDAEGKIFLIDAGHFETERGIIIAMKSFLESSFHRTKRMIFVEITGVRTNPIFFS